MLPGVSKSKEHVFSSPHAKREPLKQSFTIFLTVTLFEYFFVKILKIFENVEIQRVYVCCMLPGVSKSKEHVFFSPACNATASDVKF